MAERRGEYLARLAAVARVFAFLGLPPHAVAPTQCKLHARPLAEWVENYAARR